MVLVGLIYGMVRWMDLKEGSMDETDFKKTGGFFVGFCNGSEYITKSRSLFHVSCSQTESPIVQQYF